VKGWVLSTRRYKLRCYNDYDAPLRVLAPGYSPHRNNARYAVGQRGDITTPLTAASSRRSEI